MTGKRVWAWAAVALAAGCGGSAHGLEGPGAPATTAMIADGEVPGEVGQPSAVLAQTDWGQPVQSDGVIAYTNPGELPELRIAGDKAGLPLKHTAVRAMLSGHVAEVSVSQRFSNPRKEAIEAVYVFPLPENSAVNHMKMVVGKRSIEARIDERGAARRTYARAKSRGHTAALLEQERPNVFTQSVANIPPGEAIEVVVSYVQDLTYDQGEYEFVFPMVVGPRFIDGKPLPGAAAGRGTYSDTDLVADASRITPPIAGKGNRPGNDISISVRLDPTIEVRDLSTPTHQVRRSQAPDGATRVSLASKAEVPNRDFVLRYGVSGPSPRAAMLLSPSKAGGGHFSFVVHPPSLDVGKLVGKRELIFVVDVSGSMRGVPLGLAKSAIRSALGRLRPVDTFNIITFAGTTGKAFKAPAPANAEHLKRALDYIGGLGAGGGTRLADGVTAALSAPVASGRHRYVFFLTDGYIGGEQRVFEQSRKFVAQLATRGQRARVFGFGIGSSVNRYLIEGLSRSGNGVSVYATAAGEPERGVNRFFHYIDRAVLTDLRIDWGGAEVSQVLPTATPDLFASHPVVLHGRYTKPPSNPVVLRGTAGEGSVQVVARVSKADAKAIGRGVHASLWARAKVTDLEQHLWDGPSPAARREITQLGKDFSLLTRFTSFVAVDKSRVVSGGKPTTVVQPVAVPQGVDAKAAGARPTDPGPAPGAGTPVPPATKPKPIQPLDPSTVAREEAMTDADEGDDYGDDAPAAAPEAGSFEVDSKRGCGCRAPGSPAGPASDRWLALVLAAAAVSRRNRRREAPSAHAD